MAPGTDPRTDRRTLAIRALAVVDFLLLLLPPVHWMFASGSATASLAYFLGSGAFVVLSLGVIHRLDRDREAAAWTS